MRETAEQILAHCERQRSYLAPNQRHLIDRRYDFIAATYLLDVLDRVRAIERAALGSESVSAFEHPNHLCNGKCPDEGYMDSRDPECLYCLLMDLPA